MVNIRSALAVVLATVLFFYLLLDAELCPIRTDYIKYLIHSAAQTTPFRSPTVPPFPYTPLDLTQNDIRLLVVHPGRESDDIRCSLSLISLDANPTYAALSYTWGPPVHHPASRLTWPFRTTQRYMRKLFPSISTINVDGHIMEITDNLRSALLHLRRSNEMLTIWVDAICINQQDNKEKELQVGVMHRIYKQAARTYVWLGPAADDSDNAMGFVRSLGAIELSEKSVSMRLMVVFYNLLLIDIDDKIKPISSQRALVHLFSRSWWTRIWVIQEVVFSSDVIVQCGNVQVPFNAFVKLFNVRKMILVHFLHNAQGLDRYVNFGWNVDLTRVPLPPLLQLIDTLERHRVKTCQIEMRLWDLLPLTNMFQSTIDVDMIYALLGLVLDEDRAAIKVDYTSSAADAFKGVVMHLIRLTGSIDPLMLIKRDVTTAATSGLPSWVPDLGQPGAYDSAYAQLLYCSNQVCGNRTSMVFGSAQSNATSLFSGIGSSDSLNATFHEEYTTSINRSVLTLHGTRFDTISIVAPPSGSRPHEDILAWEFDTRSYTNNPYGSTEARLNAFSRTLVLNAEFLFESNSADCRIYCTPDEYYRSAFEAYIRPMETMASLDKEFSQDLHIREMIYQTLLRVPMESRTFAITTQGYLVMAPKVTEPGDLVCFFEQGRVPFIIRQVGDGRYWELVGQTYVHGIMCGEALKGVTTSDVQEFRLV